MTTSSLYATSLVAGAVGTSANALGAPSGTWTTDADNTNWDARFAMGDIPTPGDVLDGTQTITVRVRKEAGTGNPTLTAEVWENGVFVATLFTSRTVTSTTGVDEAATFNPALVTNPNDVQIRVVGTSSGGGPSARSTPQIDGITWTCNHAAQSVFDLVVADSAHAHTVDAAGALTQVHVLTVADAFHGHTVEAVVVEEKVPGYATGYTKGYAPATTATLAVADAVHGHTVDAVALTQAHTLAGLSDAAHAHVVESVALTQAHQLSGVADSAHPHSVDAVALTQAHSLTGVSDATHAHTVEPVTLAAGGALAVSDASHGHSVEAVTLTQVHNLAVADAAHAHNVEAVSLTQMSTLTVLDVLHAHTAETTALTQAHTLAGLSDAFHGHTVESPAIFTVLDLIVADASHSHGAESVTIEVTGILITPPTYIEGAVRPGQPSAQRAMARITGPRLVGKTLYRVDGIWHLEVTPTSRALAGADIVLGGGRWHLVDIETYEEILAAGITPGVYA